MPDTVTTPLSPEGEATCADCGLTWAELDCDPEEDTESTEDGHGALCPDCYEAQTAWCAACDDTVWRPTTPPHLLAVWDPEAFDGEPLPPGLYQVTRWPFFYDAMLYGGLYANRLTYLGPLPSWMTEEDALDGLCCLLCRECERDLLWHAVLHADWPL